MFFFYLKSKTEAFLWPTILARLLPEIIGIFIMNAGILRKCYKLDCVNPTQQSNKLIAWITSI